MQSKTTHQFYSENGFAIKLAKNALNAGKEVIEKSLYMHEALKDEDTPKWAKTTIIGALGYLISPIDAIPDLAPVVGYVDDLGVLAGAFATVAVHVKETHIAKAKERMNQWFN